MYKLLFFLHKSDDENVLKHFEEVTVNHLKEIQEMILWLPE